ncbi:unnamed protein product [Effrenium voratum]|uniref:J domain-containing protein n=1 Tax=Effrenium voratum TaxID=2562239 RepID=A0AA36IQY8_9DINO|nr:unnamed protein product [Effrenium voratum]CAJ1445831.1 unnamed protein product [Effrenium voratum]
MPKATSLVAELTVANMAWRCLDSSELDAIPGASAMPPPVPEFLRGATVLGQATSSRAKVAPWPEAKAKEAKAPTSSGPPKAAPSFKEAAAPSSGATSAGAAKPRADPSDPDLGPKVFPSTSARSASPRKEVSSSRSPLKREDPVPRSQILADTVARVLTVKFTLYNHGWSEVLLLHSGFGDSDVDRKKRELLRVLHPDKRDAQSAQSAGGEERCKEAYDVVEKSCAAAKKWLEEKRGGKLPPWEPAPRFFAPGTTARSAPQAAPTPTPSTPMTQAPMSVPAGWRNTRRDADTWRDLSPFSRPTGVNGARSAGFSQPAPPKGNQPFMMRFDNRMAADLGHRTVG